MVQAMVLQPTIAVGEWLASLASTQSEQANLSLNTKACLMVAASSMLIM